VSATSSPAPATTPEEPAHPAPGVGPPADVCPLCGAPLDSQQEWCLRCGAAARTRLAAAPNWKVPAAVLASVVALSLGVLAAALVKLAGSGSARTTTTTVTAAAPAASVPAAPVTPTTTRPGSTPGGTTTGGTATGGTGTATSPGAGASGGTEPGRKTTGTVGAVPNGSGLGRNLEARLRKLRAREGK
jgi:hypothetical protein